MLRRKERRRPVTNPTDTILVVNPNSTERVTRGIDAALEPLRIAGGPVIRCETLAEGPPGIESQRDADSVILPLCRLVAAREATRRPVLGIAECGILTALTLGQRFGIIAILKRSVPRHLRYVAAMGIGDRCVGDLPIGLGIAELGEERLTLERMAAAGKQLRDEREADVVVMGCAGMARYREPLQEALGIP